MSRFLGEGSTALDRRDRVLPVIAMTCAALLLGQLWTSADTIYVSGFGSKVSKFNTTGTPTNQTIINLGVFQPTGIAVDECGYLFVTLSYSNFVSKHTTLGSNVSSSFITGLSSPWSMACDGDGRLYVATYTLANTNGRIPDSAFVGVYDSKTGAAINPALITGLDTPWIALDGNGFLFVANKYRGTVGKFTTAGTAVNPALVSGLSYPTGIAFDGEGHFFVANTGSGIIGEYDATTGGVVNAALISGLSSPQGLAVGSNGHLYVALNTTGAVAEYTTTGALVNSRVFSAAGNPEMLVIVPDPQVGLKKAVKPTFRNLQMGLNYQLQISGDTSNWTNQGEVFTATNGVMEYPQYWDVDNWGALFFRVKTTP